MAGLNAQEFAQHMVAKTQVSKEFSKSIMRAAKAMHKDTHKTTRLHLRECIGCYYKHKAFPALFEKKETEYKCQGCRSNTKYPTTRIPRYCNVCSYERHICVRCGGFLWEIKDLGSISSPNRLRIDL